MNEERTKLLAKIRKLLELGDAAKNNSVHEAALAVSMAQELMFKHKIAVAEIEDAPADDFIAVDVHENEKSLGVVTWRRVILASLGYVNSCDVVHEVAHVGAKSKVMVFGPQMDVNAISYMYKYLCREVDRLAKHAINTSFRGTASAKAFGNSFRLGAARVIAARLAHDHDARVNANADKWNALVKRTNDRIKELLSKRYKEGLSEKNADTRKSPLDRLGYTLGCYAGARVQLDGNGRGQLSAATPELKEAH